MYQLQLWFLYANVQFAYKFKRTSGETKLDQHQRMESQSDIWTLISYMSPSMDNGSSSVSQPLPHSVEGAQQISVLGRGNCDLH